ncbi:hypothetical protein ACGFJC_47125 [Nonomuraea fuscirosea]|uniref:hypothetical protein n=1 Tax=Nonomuraea fuscirosea TaxID=1291556 RepID=UPI00371F2C99
MTDQPDQPDSHVHNPKPVGELLDKMGVSMCLHEGDFVSDVVVVFKVLTTEGVIRVGMATSDDIQGYDMEAMLSQVTDHVRFGTS